MVAELVQHAGDCSAQRPHPSQRFVHMSHYFNQTRIQFWDIGKPQYCYHSPISRGESRKLLLPGPILYDLSLCERK